MATLDVSDLTDDEDFADPFDLVRRTSTPNDFGENVLTETPTSCVGSVQPGGGLARRLFPDVARPQDWVKIYAPVRMASASPTDPQAYADVVVFRGVRYVVKDVDDWMHFGAGYCRALCLSENAK